MRRSLPLLVPLLAAGCAAPAEHRIEILLAADPSDLEWERVRIEVALDAGIGVWERAAAPGAVVAIDAGTPWSGALRVWGFVLDEDGPRVAAWGEVHETPPGERTIEVVLRPAADSDGDWVNDPDDLCPDTPDPRQRDRDGDTIGDACDRCPTVGDREQPDADGDTIGDACDPQTCGNGTPEAGEVCDDGNRNEGDGCDAECRAVPACGNGLVEAGEACDDGNWNEGDGCDGECRHRARSIVLAGPPEDGLLAARGTRPRPIVLWTDLAGAGDPPERAIHAAAIGPDGGFVVHREIHRGRNPRPVAVGVDRARETVRLLWTEFPGSAGVPAEGLAAAEIPADLERPIETPRRLESEGIGLLAWSTFDPVPAADFLDRFHDAPGPVRRLDLEPWPPRAGEAASLRSYVGCDHLAGVAEPSGGRLVAWSGVRDGSPARLPSVWVRRFDADGDPIDPAELLLHEADVIDEIAVFHDPAAREYVVAVRAARFGPEPAAWFRLSDRRGEPARGPYRTDITGSRDAGLIFTAGGTAVAWRLDAPSGRCRLRTVSVGPTGEPTGTEREVTLLPELTVTSCGGSATVLDDGRILFLLAPVQDTPVPRYHLGWYLGSDTII
jgi:cysteine-rich repeat protein